MKRMMRHLAALILLSMLPAAARGQAARGKAPAPPPAAAAILRAVRIEGLKHYSPEQVSPILGLKPDQPVTPQEFERARDRLLATGCIEAVGWRFAPVPPRGLEVTFTVTEPGQFLPWVLDRVPVTPEEFQARAERDVPLFGKLIPPSDTVLQRAAQSLESLAAARGMKEPMAGRVTILGKDQMTVVFGPKAPPPNVAEVRFQGARAIEARYLVKAMAGVAIGMPFFEPNFRFLLDNQIRPLYEATGRLRARFPRLTAQPAAGLSGVVVTVEVDEGPVYLLEKITVRGTPLSDDEIQEEGQFKTGQPASFSGIGQGLNRVLDRLRASGHMNASYKAARRLNDEKKTVEIFVDVNPGPIYNFGKLEIKGLDLQSEPAIRRLWGLKPGAPYRGGYAESFVASIREMDLFDNLGDIRSDVKLNEKALTVDVLLTFLGEKPKTPKRRPF